MENIVEACTEMIRPVCFGSKGYVVFWTCACEEKILPKSYKYMACMFSESISFAIPLLSVYLWWWGKWSTEEVTKTMEIRHSLSGKWSKKEVSKMNKFSLSLSLLTWRSILGDISDDKEIWLQCGFRRRRVVTGRCYLLDRYWIFTGYISYSLWTFKVPFFRGTRVQKSTLKTLQKLKTSDPQAKTTSLILIKNQPLQVGVPSYIIKASSVTGFWQSNFVDD